MNYGQSSGYGYVGIGCGGVAVPGWLSARVKSGHLMIKQDELKV